MTLLGMDAALQDQIFSIVAAILHLGNITFTDQQSLTFTDPQGINSSLDFNRTQPTLAWLMLTTRLGLNSRRIGGQPSSN